MRRRHVTCTILDVTSNEPDNGTGDGNTEPDWLITENGDSSSVPSDRAAGGPASTRCTLFAKTTSATRSMEQ